MADKLRIGFIIGAHEYDSYHMTEMLNAMEDIQFYLERMDSMYLVLI